EIETANHCTVKADCQQVESQCPFGCYVFVHKNEAANIERLIRDYEFTCDYSCMALKDYDCVQNKCIAFYE
ncbi:MAG: hypothetical protein Q8L34_04995, partial [Candidatus Woesearchaeota archaeon]|nr:hypothetical protein [Candidatus Woesearchaeota archaeon]